MISLDNHDFRESRLTTPIAVVHWELRATGKGVDGGGGGRGGGGGVLLYF